PLKLRQNSAKIGKGADVNVIEPPQQPSRLCSSSQLPNCSVKSGACASSRGSARANIEWLHDLSNLNGEAALAQGQPKIRGLRARPRLPFRSAMPRRNKT